MINVLTIKKSTIRFTLFLMLLITASIPYLAYGINAIQSGYKVIGGLNRTRIMSGGIGAAFAYFKDIFAVLLFFCTIKHIKYRDKKFIISCIHIGLVGTLSLMITRHDIISFCIAGIRTFLFFISTVLFCRQYVKIMDPKKISLLNVCIQACLFLQTIIVLLQIMGSGSLAKFGSGAYRFSGLFPGSGNLGCYSIGVYLFIITLRYKQNANPIGLFWFNSLQVIFLSFASGTRTCMFLSVFCFAIFLIAQYGERLHLSKSGVGLVLIVCFIALAPIIYNFIVNRVGRGTLMDSGSGRIEYLLNMISTASAYEFILGRGLGVGTNASVSMNLLDTQVSDSTINLIFTQFGIIGLGVFLFLILITLFRLYINTPKQRYLWFCYSTVIMVMTFVGNLFEHIAMCILLTATGFFLAQDQCASHKNNN